MPHSVEDEARQDDTTEQDVQVENDTQDSPPAEGSDEQAPATSLDDIFSKYTEKDVDEDEEETPEEDEESPDDDTEEEESSEQEDTETEESVSAEETAKPEGDRIAPDDWKKLSDATKEQLKSWRKEVQTLRQQTQTADFGSRVSKFLDDNGISDEYFSTWMNLGASALKAHQGQGDKQAAIESLLHAAKELGYQPPQAPPTEPVLPPDLQALVDDGEMTETAAKAIAAKLNPPKPPEQRESLFTAQQKAEAYQKRVADSQQAVIGKLKAAQERLGSQYAALDAEIKRELMSLVDDDTPPEVWPKLAEKAVNLVVERHKSASKKSPPPATPTTVSRKTAAKTRGKKKSAMDSVYSKYAR